MKVCLINTYDSTGGAAIACRRLLRALNGLEDMEATMLVASGKTEDPDIERLDRSALRKWQFRFNLAFERLQFKPYHNREVNEFYFSLADTGMDISNHPAVAEADILHLHWINLGFLSISGIRKLAALGKPVVWTLHDMWAFTGGCHYSGECTNYTVGCGQCPFLKMPSDHDLSRRLNKEKAAFDRFSFVACSDWLRSEAERSSLLRQASVLNIRNPIDLETYCPGDSSEARRALGLRPDGRFILFAAANLEDYRKGFRFLQEALQKMAAAGNTGQTPELLVFGKGREEGIELPFPVHRLGSLSSEEEIVQAYRAADLFAIPSLQDNLPNTVVEAMACGIPVVGFNSGGIPEMIDHRINGYLANLRDAADLAEGMKYILTRPDTGPAAREKAVQLYDPANIGRQYADLYRTLLHRNP